MRGLVKKIVPLAKKGIKKIANSDILRETGNKLLEHSVTAGTDILAKAIDPTKNSNPVEKAKEGLDLARKDIADLIRSKKGKVKRKKKLLKVPQKI